MTKEDLQAKLPCWVVMALEQDGGTTVRAIDLTQGMANDHRKMVEQSFPGHEPIKVWVEPSQINHCFAQSILDLGEEVYQLVREAVNKTALDQIRGQEAELTEKNRIFDLARKRITELEAKLETAEKRFEQAEESRTTNGRMYEDALKRLADEQQQSMRLDRRLHEANCVYNVLQRELVEERTKREAAEAKNARVQQVLSTEIARRKELEEF